MNIKSTLQRVGFLAVFCLVPFAHADTLQYVGGGVYPGFGSYYVGPYQVKINGAAAVSGICDDFVNTIPGSTPWTAIRHDLTVAGLVGARYYDGSAAALQKYFQVAYLSQKLIAATTAAVRGYIQYAIWDIFNPPLALNALSGDNQTAAQAYKDEAIANATAADGAGWSVYTPTGVPNSQEFLVKTPETSAAALLGFNLAALIGLVIVFRRRMTGVSQ